MDYSLNKESVQSPNWSLFSCYGRCPENFFKILWFHCILTEFSQGYYLDRCHQVCTSPSGGWHLYKWHMVPLLSGSLNWPLGQMHTQYKAVKISKVYQISNFHEWHLATHWHSGKWYPLLEVYPLNCLWGMIIKKNLSSLHCILTELYPLNWLHTFPGQTVLVAFEENFIFASFPMVH